GAAHTCARLADGTVRCWGDGGNGRLGYGNTNNIGDNEAPITAGAVSVGGNVAALATGGGHTCGLLANRAVRCWGANSFGQLGYGFANNIGDNEAPSTAGPVDLGSGSSAAMIATGELHSCAVLSNGTVRCWGLGSEGRLGYASTTTIGDNE